jgi:hypothetical protein
LDAETGAAAASNLHSSVAGRAPLVADLWSPAIDSVEVLNYLAREFSAFLFRENMRGISGRWSADMAKKVADSTSKKNSDLNEEFMAIDAENVEFETEEEEEAVAPRANQKDPSIRRKIEDLLERRRLRDELGIYDDEAWEGL